MMKFIDNCLYHFESVCNACFEHLSGDEALTVSLSGEAQLYLRLNQARVRQTTTVEQGRYTLRYQTASRRLTLTFDVTGHVDRDRAIALSLLSQAREEVKVLPDDPFVVPVVDHGQSQEIHPGQLPTLTDLLAQIARESGTTDFSGLYAGGRQIRASRNSAGMRHVFATTSFCLDYSLFTRNAAGDNKAVKGQYAGHDWSPARFAVTLAADRQRLTLLERDSHAVTPGDYRAYFAPAAVDAMIHMFSWGGVSYSAWKKGDSALAQLIRGDTRLSPHFSLRENFDLGLSPRFNSLGEMAPAQLSVIEHGALQNLLVSSRSGQEYGVPANGADPGEGLRSADMANGNLSDSAILSTLGTGLFIGNLHYLNWSDHHSARITGMTRYACFWVEQGEIVAPIQDLRFDESLYRLFGTELEAVTDATETRMATDTYGQRAVGGSRVPGMLVGNVRFTL